MKGIKQTLFQFMPASMRLPFWYHLHIALGTAEDEILKLSEFVIKGKIALDIGANIGLFSYALAKLCPEVEAFEPQPDCADTLKAYAARSTKNIRVHGCGLSDKTGELSLGIPMVDGKPIPGLASFRPGEGPQAHLTVPVKRLDDFAFQNVGFIKIDVEGHEIEVLRGAEATLLREKPVLLIEIEQRHITFPMQDIFAWVLGRGYSGYFLHQKRRHDLAEFTYAEFQEPYLDDVLAERYARIRGKYVNNFIFLPR